MPKGGSKRTRGGSDRYTVYRVSDMDTTTSTGKLLLGVLASIAEFEADIRRERQREGIDLAKQRVSTRDVNRL
jgi:DNA invertase Pin-like site-specific DNA recombinase